MEVSFEVIRVIITHSCTGDEYQRLLTTGVPTEAFLPEGSRMNLKYRVRDIDHTNQYSRKKISADRQLSDFQQFLEEPTKPDIMIVSSYPNDYAAKCVGLFCLMQLSKFFFSKDIRKKELSARGINCSPRWHSVYATFDDSVISKHNGHIPSMYVFSEVVDNSTPRKMELLRELLVRTSKVKRLVVTSSSNPVEFADTLRIRASSYLWLLPKGD